MCSQRVSPWVFILGEPHNLIKGFDASHSFAWLWVSVTSRFCLPLESRLDRSQSEAAGSRPTPNLEYRCPTPSCQARPAWLNLPETLCPADIAVGILLALAGAWDDVDGSFNNVAQVVWHSDIWQCNWKSVFVEKSWEPSGLREGGKETGWELLPLPIKTFQIYITPFRYKISYKTVVRISAIMLRAVNTRQLFDNNWSQIYLSYLCITWWRKGGEPYFPFLKVQRIDHLASSNILSFIIQLRVSDTRLCSADSTTRKMIKIHTRTRWMK